MRSLGWGWGLKMAKLCGRPLWMAPNAIVLFTGNKDSNVFELFILFKSIPSNL